MKDLNPKIDMNKTWHISRREFLRHAGLLITGTAIASSIPLSACRNNTEGTETATTFQTETLSTDVIYSPDTLKENRIPPGQREVQACPILHEGAIPQIDHSEWTFTISGLVENKNVLTHSEFMALPTVKVFSDVHCVTGWTKLNNLWEGVSSREIADLAKVKSEAKFVIVKSDYRKYSANMTLEDFLKEDVLFAVKYDGLDLTTAHGAPARLVVPRLYFWKSVKWVTGIEFTDRDRPGFWEVFGYNNHGDPWKEERY
jgi:DMSO/TMAO reductase YedYZ molybdopterin-dependent catalytic subunit